MKAEGPAEHVVGLVDGEEVQEDEAGLDDEGRGVLVRGGPGAQLQRRAEGPHGAQPPRLARVLDTQPQLARAVGAAVTRDYEHCEILVQLLLTIQLGYLILYKILSYFQLWKRIQLS